MKKISFETVIIIFVKSIRNDYKIFKKLIKTIKIILLNTFKQLSLENLKKYILLKTVKNLLLRNTKKFNFECEKVY